MIMLGDKLKQLRGSASQSGFAEKLGIKQTTYSAYERNKIEPSASIILLICQRTGVSADWLLGIKESPPADRKTDLAAAANLDAMKRDILSILAKY